MAIKFESAYGEDLLTLAKENYQTASKLCGTCRSYHSVWPYLRIADALFDVGEQRHFQTALAKVAETGSARKWLVAGSADTGVCAAVWQVLQNASVTAPQVMIVDRCATPLISCQRFALDKQFTIETCQGDILDLDSLKRFDVVVSHSLLPFFDADEQKRLLLNLSRCLRPGGYLVVASRYYVQKHADADQPRNVSDRVAKIFKALIEGGVDLPDSEQSFRQKLQDYASGNRQRISNLKRPDELAPLLEEAGLQVSENLKAFIYASGRPRGYDWTTCYFAIIAEKNS